MSHTDRLAALYARAKKVGALSNCGDAQYDLIVWPELRKKILDDLEKVIELKEGDRLVKKGQGL